MFFMVMIIPALEHSVLWHEICSVSTQGLFPVWISRSSGKFQANEILTVGAMADSFYEYLLKAWLLLRKQVLCFVGACTASQA